MQFEARCALLAYRDTLSLQISSFRTLFGDVLVKDIDCVKTLAAWFRVVLCRRNDVIPNLDEVSLRHFCLGSFAVGREM